MIIRYCNGEEYIIFFAATKEEFKKWNFGGGSRSGVQRNKDQDGTKRRAIVDSLLQRSWSTKKFFVKRLSVLPKKSLYYKKKKTFLSQLDPRGYPKSSI